MSDGPRVYLVGAGPGDPGLLTLRGAECLRLAEVVIYDQLVNRRLLDLSPAAEQVCVEELPGPHTERLPHVSRRMIDAARAGKRVVRLKGGDPLIFGRGGEEAEALRAAGIPYEIVPGVTAALAAGAFAGIPLTHRGLASAVAFVTGHECEKKPGETAHQSATHQSPLTAHPSTLDWDALARFPGTLVIYMGVARLGQIADSLLRRGKAADTPAAVVEWASLGRQRTAEGTLATIHDRVRQAGLAAPALAIIGPVTLLRQNLKWLEDRPLFGRSVLVTRPRHQAEALVRRLEVLGAMVHTMPVIEIGPPPDPAAVDRVIDRLDEFHWLVFTGQNGVWSFLKRLLERGKDLRALARARLAAIGERTAEALNDYHLRPDLVPEAFRSEDLADALLDKVRGQRVLLLRADRGREVLREELSRVADVEQVAVYSQQDCLRADPEALALLKEGRIDFVTLTSSNVARAFLKLLDPETRGRLGREVRLVTISPVTSAAVAELGLPVAAEAREFTAEGLVQALLGLVLK